MTKLAPFQRQNQGEYSYAPFPGAYKVKPLMKYLGHENGYHSVWGDHHDFEMPIPTHHLVEMAIDPALYISSRAFHGRIIKKQKSLAALGLRAPSVIPMRSIDPVYWDVCYDVLKRGAKKEEWGRWLDQQSKLRGKPVWDLYGDGKGLYSGYYGVAYNSYTGQSSRLFVAIMIYDDDVLTMFKLAFGGV